MREHQTRPETEKHAEDHCHGISTDEFAVLNKVQPQSVRIRLCRTGSYYGITPLKLKNKRLVWPNVRAV